MTNMIGKISGKDWSKAPVDAEYVNKSTTGYSWYRVEKEYYSLQYYAGSTSWQPSEYSVDDEVGNFELISREEDLGMTEQVSKQVRTIADLKVGMFLKEHDGTIRLVLMVRSTFIKTINMTTRAESDWSENSFNKPDIFNFWSYTYAGPYTPIIKETAREKAIKAATEEIIQAQKALDNAKSKLDEAMKMPIQE